METVKTEIRNTKEDLINTISQFSEEQFNKIPTDGSWTGGKVADHLMKSMVTSLLDGKTEKTLRDPEEKIKGIKDQFLNFDIKILNPDFNTPDNCEFRKKDTMDSLEAVYSKAEIFAGTLDLSETCLDLKLPNLGYLTRIEWLFLMIYHTQRHTHQLKNILQKL